MLNNYHNTKAAPANDDVVESPLSKIPVEKYYITSQETTFKIPLYSCKVRAGFPTLADEHIEAKIDLNSHLVKHPAATFLVRAEGDSMQGAGIQCGDMLIVNRSLEVTHGKIVIAAVNNELTVKRLWRRDGEIKLLAENPAYPPIDITHEPDVVILGTVTCVIHET